MFYVMKMMFSKKDAKDIRLTNQFVLTVLEIWADDYWDFRICRFIQAYIFLEKNFAILYLRFQLTAIYFNLMSRAFQ